MVEEWLSTGNEYAVLTTYPTNVDHIGKNVNKHWEMPHLCKASFSGKGRIHNEQALAAANLEFPLLSPLWVRAPYRSVSRSPRLPVSSSPRLLVSPSPRLPLCSGRAHRTALL